MRYRPFGRSGKSTSAVTLNLGERTVALGRRGGAALITEAMEHGINAFHLQTPDPVLGELVGAAIAPVDRRLIFVAVRVGARRERGQLVRDFTPAGVTAARNRLTPCPEASDQRDNTETTGHERQGTRRRNYGEIVYFKSPGV